MSSKQLIAMSNAIEEKEVRRNGLLEEASEQLEKLEKAPSTPGKSAALELLRSDLNALHTESLPPKSEQNIW